MRVTFKFNRVRIADCSERECEVEARPLKGDVVRLSVFNAWTVSSVVHDLEHNRLVAELIEVK